MTAVLRTLAGCGALLAALTTAFAAKAQEAAVHARFVPLARGVPGVLYEPAAPGPKAATAVFIMHSAGDYLTFPGCTELARRGYRVLCANNSTSKSGASNDGVLDQVLLEAGAGVAWLRRQPGIARVVLLGHSGGGTVMSAYQAIAEGGLAFCQDPAKIWKCPSTLADLPRADGVMLVDSNWGLAEMTLFSVDPAATGEGGRGTVDPALDLFDPANGFVATGSHYGAGFTRRFLEGEGARYSAVLARAQTRFAAIEAGQGEYDDDEPFVVPGAILLAGNNKLFSQDVRLMAHTRAAWPLLHADGTTTVQVVPSVRVAENVRSETRSYLHGALKTSVRGFLSSYAVRVAADFGYDEDSVHGIDWASSYASPPGNVQAITVPLLVIGMTGHWEYLAAETIHDLARSRDRTLAFVEGATHGYTTCRACERRPGEFGDTQKTTYDYIDHWLSGPGRFVGTARPAPPIADRTSATR